MLKPVRLRPSPRSCLAGAILLIGWSVAIIFPSTADDQAKSKRLDPAAWGGDHVGKPLPPYVTGDECLFCHRDIGAAWGDNRHQVTIRRAAPDDPAMVRLRELPGGSGLAAQTQFLLGSERATRFLKRSNEYGKLLLLSACVDAHQR